MINFTAAMAAVRVGVIAVVTFLSSTAAYSQDVQIVGSYSYTATATTVTIYVEKILNSSPTRTTGKLRLELWLTNTPYSGGSIFGYRIASSQIDTQNTQNGQLGPMQYIYGLNGTLPLSNLPTSGSYSPTLIVSEYTQSCGSEDGFCIVALGGFNNYVVTFAGTSSAVNTVVEFYNTNLDNYFITADANEAAAIDNGSAGPGWSRTGNTFKSGGGTAVCRFYGSQSPGPNSHFYTADAGECAGLKQIQASTPATQKRWNFESLDFATTVPTSGSCPVGTTTVYRAYNNGFARGIDSNHRITISQTAIQQEVARGWINEGVVMCAPL
jgi:hypothetical protein